MSAKLLGIPPKPANPGKTKLLTYGPGGAGKTYFALSFPKVYYIAPEHGAERGHYQQRLLDSGGCYMGPEQGALSFPTVLAEVQKLATLEHPYQTVVFDSITKLFQTQIAQSAEEIERKGNKDEFGASKKQAVGYMRRLVSWISRLDMNVIFIAHESTEYGLVGNQRQEIGKNADIWDKLIYELDLVIQVQKRGQSRVGIVKKSRLLGFPEGDTFPLEYSEYALRYGKDFIESPVTQIKLATPEQVAELNGLLEIVKVPEEEIAKWHTKAGTSTFAEMDEAVVAKLIAYLKGKIK